MPQSSPRPAPCPPHSPTPRTAVAFLLSVLGRGVLRIADGASLFCNALSSTVPDTRALPPQQLSHGYAPQAELAPVPAQPAPPPQAASRAAAPVDPESDASIGRELAIQQMLQRSASAAANARRIESERSQIMAQKQGEAVAKALSESRQARAQPLGVRGAPVRGVPSPPLGARPPPLAPRPPPPLAARPAPPLGARPAPAPPPFPPIQRPKTYALQGSAPPAPSPPARREQAARASQFYSYQPGKPPAAPRPPAAGAAAPSAARPAAPPASSAVAGVSSAFGIPTSNKSPSLASMARSAPPPLVSRPTGLPSKMDVSLAASAKTGFAGTPKAGAANQWLPRPATAPATGVPAVAPTPAAVTPPAAPPPPVEPPLAAPPPPPTVRLSPPAAATAPPANGAPNPWLPRGYATKAAGDNESD